MLLAACGSDDTGDVATGERPKLPPVGAASASTAEARDSAAAGGADLMLYPERQIEYRLADGAEAPATSAPAYRVEADDVSEDDVVRMAKAFDLDGDVENEDRSSVVRSGSSEFRIETGPVTSWSYARDPNGTVSSGVAVACAPDTDCPAPEPPPPIPGLPSASEAEARARQLLDEMGLDVDGLRFEVFDSDAGSPRTVNWTHVVDDMDVTGFGGSITFGEQGRVEYASGQLGTFEKVGDYPLVSMQDAVERLRTGFGGGPRALATDTPGVAEAQASGGASGSGGQSSPGSAGSGEPGEVPPSPPDSSGSGSPDDPPPVDPPVDQPPDLPPPQIIEITGADVVLLIAYGNCPDDPVYAVPAFAFEPEEAGTVMAVEDESLTGAAADRDLQEPITCPGVDPATEPTGKPEPAPLPPERAPTPAPAPETAPADQP
jgi:hypothetical protein